jgi:hypothetical protein
LGVRLDVWVGRRDYRSDFSRSNAKSTYVERYWSADERSTMGGSA